MLIIDNRMRKIEKQKLKEMGYELIELKTNKEIYPEISSHVDIFACKIENEVIVEPTQYLNLPLNSKIIKGNEKVQKQYPYDIKYNVCIIGNKAIHNLKYTDSKIKEKLIENKYELINTAQGYTNCSIAVIDDKSAIVTDKGLYKILVAHNIDTLFINEKLDIKLFNDDKYSDKNGFIGGCIARIDNKIIIFGDLSKIDLNDKIRNFIKNKGYEIIEFYGLDVIDYGGIINI